MDPDEKPVLGSRQYTWLYAYSLSREDPQRLHKACVEEVERRDGGVACAASGDEIVIWQEVYEKDSPIETLRCSKWVDEGKLDWKERYTGNDPILSLVDPSHGSACLVWEWKSPMDASGILCCLRADSTDVIPVSAYESGCGRRSPKYFVRLAKRRLWAVDYGLTGDIEVVFLNDDFTPTGSVMVDRERGTDYTLVAGEDCVYVVLLRDGALSCQEVRLPSAAVAASPPPGVKDEQQ